MKDLTDAKKAQKGRAEAVALAQQVQKIIVAKGSKVITFDLKKAPPPEETLLAHLLGPTGNLRAPTLLKGKTLLVGFNEEAYQEVLGS